MESRKVVIDTDPGVDDAVALFLAFGAHKDPNTSFKILALTTVIGNGTLKHVNTNLFKILDCGEVNDIPVYSGAANPLVQKFVHDEPAHFGKDGFCEVPLAELHEIFQPNKDRQLEKESAAMALVRLAREHKGELTVVALGPLTNVALAIHIDPDFVQNVKELYVMGGSMYGVGNVRPCIEFNFLVDPDSAYVVLAAAWNKNIILVPWETCIKTLPSQKWRREVLGLLTNKPVQLMNMIEKKASKNYEKWYGDARWISADSVCIAALLKPNIVTEKSSKFCTVELHGSHTRGQLVVDHPQRSGAPHNVTLIEGLSTPEIEKLFMSYFSML